LPGLGCLLSRSLLWCSTLQSGGARREGNGRRLGHRPPPSHRLYPLDLQLDARLLASLLAEALVLFIDVEDQLLHVVAGDTVLVKEARADAQMQGLIAFLLPWSLLEARALASESQFDYLLLVVIAGALAANLNDALHVAALGPNEATGDLELLVVVNLNVKPAGILYVVIVPTIRTVATTGGRGSPHGGGGSRSGSAWLEGLLLELLVIHVHKAEGGLLRTTSLGRGSPLRRETAPTVTLLLRVEKVGLLLLLYGLLDESGGLWFLFLDGRRLGCSLWGAVVLFCLLDDPFDTEGGRVFIEVEVIQGLLCHVGSDNVRELDKRIALGMLHGDLVDIAEYLKYLFTTVDGLRTFLIIA
jgi:hypothetical protein